jgi:hypothetical protein
MTHQLLTVSGDRTPNRMKFMLAAVFVVVACGGDGGATQGGSPGTEGNHCYPNGTCNSGLLCHHKPPLDTCEKTSLAIPAPPVGMGDASGTGGTCLNCNGGVSGTPAGAAGVCLNCSSGGASAGGTTGAGGATGAPCTTDADCAGPDSCVLCSFGAVVCSGCSNGQCNYLTLFRPCVSGGVDYGPGSACGNGYLNVGLEECDGANLNGATCDSVSSGALPYGKLFCSSTCTRVLQGCSAVPIGTGGATSSGGATSTGGTDAGQVTDAAPG